ncbi:MAG TPA: Hsp20 family protein [Parvularculaceae bacterium]|nr:Hsp20 family protein [Parvularculaceae bacterium]HNS86416.1 Hsp20 family protein [Parvularculaceae bacterium]
MRSYDLTPLYRTTVGFDRMFDLLDTLGKSEAGGYPPYNIERVDEDRYRITLAVAGFGEGDLEIEIHETTLKIVGARPETDDARSYLHQGIAGRSFERRFQLADHVKVDGASLANGLLNIELRREVPETMKPRKIEINSNGAKIEVLKASNAA